MAGVLAAFIVLFLLQTFVRLNHDRSAQAARAALQGEAATVRARLESELNATLSLSLGLSAFVLSQPNFSERELARVAGSLIRLQPAISSVAIAPDNVIRYIYPRAGNEKALSLNYMDTPAQRDAVLRLMREQHPVVAGPLQLVQGGVGIVNRIPIVLAQPDGSLRYLGPGFGGDQTTAYLRACRYFAGRAAQWPSLRLARQGWKRCAGRRVSRRCRVV